MYGIYKEVLDVRWRPACNIPLTYRVNIKYFPDYKHLLQENYVEYIHIFFLNVTQLKKFFTTSLNNGKKYDFF
jgi:hypothetical protein